MIPQLLAALNDFDTFDDDEIVEGEAVSPSTGGGQVGGNLLLIETGVSKLTFKSLPLGHTLEGVKFSIAPDLRERRTDETGTYIADLVHQGDKVEIKTVLLEKSLKVLQTVYLMSYGAISETLVGIGRLPGQKASSRSGLLRIHPIAVSDTSHDVVFFNAAVSASGETNFGVVTSDRVFECTWSCLVDESQDDGSVIGRIGVSQ